MSTVQQQMICMECYCYNCTTWNILCHQEALVDCLGVLQVKRRWWHIPSHNHHPQKSRFWDSARGIQKSLLYTQLHDTKSTPNGRSIRDEFNVTVTVETFVRKIAYM